MSYRITCTFERDGIRQPWNEEEALGAHLDEVYETREEAEEALAECRAEAQRLADEGDSRFERVEYQIEEVDMGEQFAEEFRRVFGPGARAEVAEDGAVVACAQGWPQEVAYRATPEAVEALRGFDDGYASWPYGAGEEVEDDEALREAERRDAEVCAALAAAGAVED